MSKKPASLGGMVLNARPVPSTNLVSGTCGSGGQPYRPGQRLGDAGAVAARRVGVDLQVGLDVVDGWLRVVVHQVCARGIEDVVGLRVRDEVAALGQRPVVAGRNDQILAAEAAVGTWASDVDDPGEPHVVDRADRVGRLLDHHRPVGEVDGRQVVDRVGVGGQEQRARVHQLGEDDDAVRPGDLLEALVKRVGRGAAEAVVVDVERAGEVERVIDRMRGLGARHAVLELERADARLDAVGRRERFIVSAGTSAQAGASAAASASALVRVSRSMVSPPRVVRRREWHIRTGSSLPVSRQPRPRFGR